MPGDLPRELVERLLSSVALGGRPWDVREVLPIELLYPPGGPRVLEATAGGATPQGLLVLDDGSSVHLNSEDGTEEFLSRVAPALAPLAVVLTLARYRIPQVLGQPAVGLATNAGDLDPAIAGAGIPLGLDVDGNRIAFTTAFGGDGAGADRWTAVRGDPPSLSGEELARVPAGAAP
jgi:hypothetical protein